MKKLIQLTILLAFNIGFMACGTKTEKETVQQSTTDAYEFVGGYPTEATIQKAFNQSRKHEERCLQTF